MKYIKVASRLYFFICAIYFAELIWGSFSFVGLWPHPAAWLNWYLNLVGLFAIFLYAFDKNMMPPLFWRIHLFVIIANQVFHLVENGLFQADSAFAVKMTVLANYVFLVFPPTIAVFFHSHLQRQSYKEPCSSGL